MEQLLQHSWGLDPAQGHDIIDTRTFLLNKMILGWGNFKSLDRKEIMLKQIMIRSSGSSPGNMLFSDHLVFHQVKRLFSGDLNHTDTYSFLWPFNALQHLLVLNILQPYPKLLFQSLYKTFFFCIKGNKKLLIVIWKVLHIENTFDFLKFLIQWMRWVFFVFWFFFIHICMLKNKESKTLLHVHLP